MNNKVKFIAGTLLTVLIAAPVFAAPPHHDRHDKHHNEGVHLAAEIIGLVGKVLGIAEPPPPPVVAPAPVVIAPPPRPVVIAPAPVVVAPPPRPVVVAPPRKPAPQRHVAPAPKPTRQRPGQPGRHHR